VRQQPASLLLRTVNWRWLDGRDDGVQRPEQYRPAPTRRGLVVGRRRPHRRPGQVQQKLGRAVTAESTMLTSAPHWAGTGGVFGAGRVHQVLAVDPAVLGRSHGAHSNRRPW